MLQEDIEAQAKRYRSVGHTIADVCAIVVIGVTLLLVIVHEVHAEVKEAAPRVWVAV